jgi:glutamate dehydrogenase
VKEGRLDRALEFLPSDRQLAERLAAKEALTGPEYCVLLAYTKMNLAEELIDTGLPDDPSLATELVNYFPSALRERYRDRMEAHRLRREIILTQVVNNVVNNAGVTFHHRVGNETGASNEDLVRAHLVAQQVFDMHEVWSAIDGLDSKVAASVQTAMRLEGRTIAERTARWLVINRRPPIGIQSNVKQFHDGVAFVTAALPEVLVGRERTLFAERLDRLASAGVPTELARRVAVLPPAYAALGIVESAQRRNLSPVEVSRVHFNLGERLQFGLLLERIIALPREDRWQTMVRAALRDELHATHAALTAQVLDATPGGGDPLMRVTHWEDQAGIILVRARARLHEILDSETWDLAMLSVALRVVRTLVNAPV